MSTAADDAGPRPYGDERPGDVFPHACTGSTCRLARFNSGGYGCPSDRCRLEASPHRQDRVRGAYADCRRGILYAMTAENGCRAIVETGYAEGLPHNDPMTFGLRVLNEGAEVGQSIPQYMVMGEGLNVDGPHNLTLVSLRRRLDGVGKRPPNMNSSATNPSGRR